MTGEPCECCGSASGTRVVAVVSREDGEHHRLLLCRRCVAAPASVWRRRWLPEGE